jgi:hypothetical protein
MAEAKSTLRYDSGICIVVNLLGILDVSSIIDHESGVFYVRVDCTLCH